jgi:hypothetical protein
VSNFEHLQSQVLESAFGHEKAAPEGGLNSAHAARENAINP